MTPSCLALKLKQANAGPPPEPDSGGGTAGKPSEKRVVFAEEEAAAVKEAAREVELTRAEFEELGVADLGISLDCFILAGGVYLKPRVAARKARRKKAGKDLNSPRRAGKEKGTVIWRVQPEYGDVLVKELPPSGVPEKGDLTFEQAVAAARPGSRIFVRGVYVCARVHACLCAWLRLISSSSSGSHSWTGAISLNKCVQIVGAGAWVTTLKGRWWLEEYETPEIGAEGDKFLRTTSPREQDTNACFSALRPQVAGFSGVELQNHGGASKTMSLVGNYMSETVVVKGGSWRLHACKVTCSGAPPLVVAGKGDVRLLECRIGGLDGEKGKSSSGVIVTGESRCLLHTCVLEYTDCDDYTQTADNVAARQTPGSPRLADSAGSDPSLTKANSPLKSPVRPAANRSMPQSRLAKTQKPPPTIEEILRCACQMSPVREPCDAQTRPADR